MAREQAWLDHEDLGPSVIGSAHRVRDPVAEQNALDLDLGRHALLDQEAVEPTRPRERHDVIDTDRSARRIELLERGDGSLRLFEPRSTHSADDAFCELSRTDMVSVALDHGDDRPPQRCVRDLQPMCPDALGADEDELTVVASAAESVEECAVDLTKEVVEPSVAPVGVLRFLEVTFAAVAYVPLGRQSAAVLPVEVTIDEPLEARAVRVPATGRQHEDVDVVSGQQIGDGRDERERVADDRAFGRTMCESKDARQVRGHVAGDAETTLPFGTAHGVLERGEPLDQTCLDLPIQVMGIERCHGTTDEIA